MSEALERMSSEHAGDERWSLVTAVKDTRVLDGVLRRSPDVDGRCELITKCGYASAGRAYNEGLSEATNELVVFAHTDVYLPAGWIDDVRRAIADLEQVDPHWGVLGVCGLTADGDVAGLVYSVGSGRFFGAPLERAVETMAPDEMLLIVRRSAGLTFDEALGFHLYGSDLCRTALNKGLKSYIVSAFCIHNSIGIRGLPRAFWDAYFYYRRKHWDELPARTCCAVVSRSAWQYWRSVVSGWCRPRNKAPGARVEDVERFYLDLMASSPPGLFAGHGRPIDTRSTGP